MLYTGFLHEGPASVRYPRGSGPGVEESIPMSALSIGKAEMRREMQTPNEGVAILAFGTMLAPALEVAEQIDATVINMRFVKPLDEELILEVADTYKLIVTVEENVLAGGAGSAVNELLIQHEKQVETMNLGLPDQHLDHGTQQQQLAQCGLDAQGILNQIHARLENTGTAPAPTVRNMTLVNG